MRMITIGTRVYHSGHGYGTIVDYNGQQRNRYLEERPREAVEIASSLGIDMTQPLINSFYNGDRYPYIIRFDYGYQDVYSEQEFEVNPGVDLPQPPFSELS